MSHIAIDRQAGGLSWREAGEGPPVVLLHGLGGSRRAWESQLEVLSDRFRCIAWDMPGYGRSAPLDHLSFAAIADAVARLLDIVDVECADLVGLSFGGQQAMHTALAHPSRVRRLVLADTSARFGADGTDAEAWKQRRLAPLDAGVTPAEMAPVVLDAITAPGFAGLERDRAIAAFAEISGAGLRASVECLPSHDVSDRLADITIPSLVIVGEFDIETPLEYAQFIADHIPDSRLEVVSGAGHLVPSERPDEFNRLVAEFLGS